MTDLDELCERLHLAKAKFLEIHKRESKALRRKLFPAELVKVAKDWATDLLDAVEKSPGQPKLRKYRSAEGTAFGVGHFIEGEAGHDAAPIRCSLGRATTAGQVYYHAEIAAAEAVLDVITEIGDPIAIVMAFRKRYPVEFDDVRYLPQHVRVIEGKNNKKLYFIYRRPGFDTRLPASPIGPEFMRAYHKAERAYQARKLHKSYNARPQLLAAAA